MASGEARDLADEQGDGASVFAVPVQGQWLLHAPLHRVTALCGERSFIDLLARPGAPLASGRLGPLQEVLRSTPPAAPAPCTGPLRPEFLGIIPTRACNMACRYCAFRCADEPHGIMSESLALNAVAWMAEQAKTHEPRRLTIDFFGGEPMVAPHLVKAVVRRAHELAAQSGLTTSFELATNGCFGDEDRRFVRDQIDNVVLSFDGPPEVHDLHRPLRNGHGSYEWVSATAAALSSGKTNLCIRVCVTQASVGRLAGDVEWFCRRFRPATVTVEPLRPGRESEQAGFEKPDPVEFARAVHRATRAARPYGVPVVYASAQIHRITAAFCPVAKDVPILTPEGNVHACYMMETDWRAAGLDLQIGHLEAGHSALAVDLAALTRVRNLSRVAPECKTCFCRWHCAGGCLVNMAGSRRKNGGDGFCIQTRILCALALLDHLGRCDLADALADDPTALDRLAVRDSDGLRPGPAGFGIQRPLP